MVRKLQFLYAEKQYAEFSWCLLLWALFQREVTPLSRIMRADMQYTTIVEILSPAMRDHFLHAQMTEICEEATFWSLRKNLIRSARGHLIIAGPSLMEAFNLAEKEKCIVNEIREAVNTKCLERLSIVLTDPIIFDQHEKCGEPIRDTKWAVDTMQESLYDLFEDQQVELHIYFLPLLQIDHAVITEEFMLMRSTKLWTREREYKGAYMLFLGSCYTRNFSEYRAHKEYLLTIMRNSTKIYPDVDTDDGILAEDSPRSQHMQWRKRLRDKNYHYIFMHKLYEKQLSAYVRNTWRPDAPDSTRFIPNRLIQKRMDLFECRNLLGDDTQQVLLEYLKETETLFNRAIQKHDPFDHSGCEIFPSLDLGMPNNVQRLAGGFATGMLVTWNCGVDIVPIDATVNVCTSSVFKLDSFDIDLLKDRKHFGGTLKSLFHAASEVNGYSFSFTSGNHFLIIGTSPSAQGGDDYYLVLHSSAQELKNSYLGLYPVEKNWYSADIKHVGGENGRYFRYLKDETARQFITMAHHFEQYNEQIHQWLAEMINESKPCGKKWVKHHYYMPTDSSIALGTFVEPEGTEVPIFSAPGKPVYIFKIGSGNWTVDLGEKRGRVCLVPHGWGQQIDHIQGIHVDGGCLILTIAGKDISYQINSKERIGYAEKKLRDYASGEEFLKVGSRFVQGSIELAITPCYEDSVHTNGAKSKGQL